MSPNFNTWFCMHRFLREFKAILRVRDIKEVSIFGGFVREILKEIMECPHEHFLRAVPPRWLPDNEINDIDFLCDFGGEKDKILECLEDFGYTFEGKGTPMYSELTDNQNTTYKVGHRDWKGLSFKVDFIHPSSRISLDFLVNGFKLDLQTGKLTHRTETDALHLYKILSDWKEGKVTLADEFRNVEDKTFFRRVFKMVDRGVKVSGCSFGLLPNGVDRSACFLCKQSESNTINRAKYTCYLVARSKSADIVQ